MRRKIWQTKIGALAVRHAWNGLLSGRHDETPVANDSTCQLAQTRLAKLAIDQSAAACKNSKHFAQFVCKHSS